MIVLWPMAGGTTLAENAPGTAAVFVFGELSVQFIADVSGVGMYFSWRFVWISTPCVPISHGDGPRGWSRVGPVA